MGVEIERKFLVKKDLLRTPMEGQLITQGYLSDDPCVRIRIIDNSKAYFTVKGPGLLERAEFEYEVPVADGLAMLTLAKTSLSKTRYKIGPWEVDRFRGALEGLWLAEIELDSADQYIGPELCRWVGREVTHDSRFANLVLAKKGLPEGWDSV